jgi:hypothetical protein
LPAHARAKTTNDLAVPGAPRVPQGSWAGADALAQVKGMHVPEEDDSYRTAEQDSDAIMADASTLHPAVTPEAGAESDDATADEDEDDMDEDEGENWTMMAFEDAEEQRQIVERIQQEFKEELDYWDTTMVAEYSEEIFAYMAELEVRRRVELFTLRLTGQ